MKCPRCAQDPQPTNFGNPRGCAFDNPSQTFQTDNWNCATISALLDYTEVKELFGCDESMQIVPAAPVEGDGWGAGESQGWLVFTRYKRRGKTSNAVHVGDFPEARPLTLAQAEKTIELLAWLSQPRAGLQH